ncbi:hypothetical protein JDFnp4_125 [Fusobacterium phage JD-Fnp4]|nr:hypothetical protein JDFnp4_125 [Fusobacterium phage JD-Fnp4]
MSNKLVMSLINKFMVENEEDIIEFITHPEGELAQKWIEQGEAVKEYIGYNEPNKDGVVFRPPTIEDEVVRVIHKDTLERIKRKHLHEIKRYKKKAKERREAEKERESEERASKMLKDYMSPIRMMRGDIL